MLNWYKMGKFQAGLNKDFIMNKCKSNEKR